MQSNPRDISYGEQQYIALLKVLSAKPEILILDEPTKGLDASYKKSLGEILQKLEICVIMVSHDTEFCAEYADRCGLFFDGKIISVTDKRTFLGGNNFYTTAASKMTRPLYNADALTAQDVVGLYKCPDNLYQ